MVLLGSLQARELTNVDHELGEEFGNVVLPEEDANRASDRSRLGHNRISGSGDVVAGQR